MQDDIFLNPSPQYQPLVAQFFYKLGKGAERAGRQRQAAEHFLQAARFDSGNALYWVNLAGAHHQLQELTAAVECFTTALDLLEQDPLAAAVVARVYRLRGALYRQLGCETEAAADLVEAVQRGIRDWEVMKELVDCYCRLGRFDEAVALRPINQAVIGQIMEHVFITQGSCRSCGQCCRGICLLSRGEPVRCIETMEQAWQDNPATTRFQPIRGMGRGDLTGFSASSEQIWAALVAQGYLDETGATRVKFIQTETLALPGLSLSAESDPDVSKAIRVKSVQAESLVLPDLSMRAEGGRDGGGGITRMASLQGEPILLPGLPLSADELEQVRWRIRAAPIRQVADGSFLFHCRYLTADHRCADHPNRLETCRNFPTGRSLPLPGCGYSFTISPAVAGIRNPGLLELIGWFAEQKGLSAEFTTLTKLT